MRYASCLLAVAPVLLAACVETDIGPQVPIDPTPVDSCGAVAYQNFVGKPGVLLDGMRFAQNVRVIQHDMAVTMDYSATRLNFWLDRRDVIERVTCG
jgi:Peptidase inhibitor I78 family